MTHLLIWMVAGSLVAVTASICLVPPAQELLPSGWAEMIVQLPLVAVFVWFALKLLQLQKEERDARDASYQKERVLTHEQYQKERAVTYEQWRDWLNVQMEKSIEAYEIQGKSNEAVLRQLGELKKEVGHNSVTLMRHMAVVVCSMAKERGEGPDMKMMMEAIGVTDADTRLSNEE